MEHIRAHLKEKIKYFCHQRALKLCDLKKLSGMLSFTPHHCAKLIIVDPSILYNSDRKTSAQIDAWQ